MNMVELIIKKKQGLELTKEEISFIVEGISKSLIPDYQIAAWAMAVCFEGMTDKELFTFTNAIIASGEMVDLNKITGFKVDKHSTGGIGDKTSLVFGPIAASLGLKVTKMSGRGLGITGGTIDKLETIPNFRFDLSIREFSDVVNKVGMSIISQTGNLVPADKKLYALRDVTGTIDSLPLIAASVMSKKIAMGADLILLDVKCGQGAFVQDIAVARKLAQLMIKIGKNFQKKVYVIISDMDKPLGRTIGNTLELQEAIRSLQNQGPNDLKELVVNLVALALLADNKAKDFNEGKQQATEAFNSNKGLEIFYDFVSAQGGDLNYIKNIMNIKPASHIIEIKAQKAGYLDFTNNYLLGELSVILGAGRLVKDDIIDPSAGIVLKNIHGDKVNKNQVIMELHTNKLATKHQEFINLATKAYVISEKKVKQNPLILEIIM